MTSKSIQVAVQENVNKESASLSDWSRFTDVFFSILFIINTTSVFILCVTAGVSALIGPEPDKKTISGSGEHHSDESNEKDAFNWLGGSCIMSLVAALLSVLFVHVISSLSATSVSCTLYTVLAFSGVCAVFLLTVGNVVGGVLAFILLLATFGFFYYVKNKITFEDSR